VEMPVIGTKLMSNCFSDKIPMNTEKKRQAPKVGSRFVINYVGKPRTLHVIERNGKICYEMNRKIYSSPSGAAKALTKGSVNGWKFWNMD
jgi:hypothetical protein